MKILRIEAQRQGQPRPAAVPEGQDRGAGLDGKVQGRGARGDGREQGQGHAGEDQQT